MNKHGCDIRNVVIPIAITLFLSTRSLLQMMNYSTLQGTQWAVGWMAESDYNTCPPLAPYPLSTSASSPGGEHPPQPDGGSPGHTRVFLSLLFCRRYWSCLPVCLSATFSILFSFLYSLCLSVGPSSLVFFLLYPPPFPSLYAPHLHLPILLSFSFLLFLPPSSSAYSDLFRIIFTSIPSFPLFLSSLPRLPLPTHPTLSPLNA